MEHDGSLKGRTILVTGAASGFGLIMGTAFLRAGARVVLTDISSASAPGLAQIIDQFGDQAISAPADLRNGGEVDALVRAVRSRVGTIDVLVNNAGVAPAIVRRNYVTDPVRFWEHSEAQTQMFFAVNAIAPFRLAVHLVPDMIERGWGRIISVTTSLGSMLRAGMAGYGGSKASLEAHTAIFAGDLADTGVTANVLIPGGASDTPMVPLESGFDRTKLIQPEAMVAPALWLASRDADGVTGKRFIAAYWDPTLPASAAAEKAMAPIAWSGLGEQTIFPKNYVQQS
jgi:NAD(P)-dependent dehydrogenase (short-subunit alcohol dehydrogenase family)